MSDSTPRPRRIQRKRTKDWKMPIGAVYVGRPSRFGNPFRVGTNREIGEVPDAALAVELFQDWMTRPEAFVLSQPPNLAPLRGKDLVCWCALGAPCHADVLLELANS